MKSSALKSADRYCHQKHNLAAVYMQAAAGALSKDAYGWISFAAGFVNISIKRKDYTMAFDEIVEAFAE